MWEEALYRMRECVFGVLVLENETVDPGYKALQSGDGYGAIHTPYRNKLFF